MLSSVRCTTLFMMCSSSFNSIGQFPSNLRELKVVTLLTNAAVVRRLATLLQQHLRPKGRRSARPYSRLMFHCAASNARGYDPKFFPPYHTTPSNTVHRTRVGQSHINIYIWCTYGSFDREITRYTVVNGVFLYGSGQRYKRLLVGIRPRLCFPSLLVPCQVLR